MVFQDSVDDVALRQCAGEENLQLEWAEKLEFQIGLHYLDGSYSYSHHDALIDHLQDLYCCRPHHSQWNICNNYEKCLIFEKGVRVFYEDSSTGIHKGRMKLVISGEPLDHLPYEKQNK